MRASAAVVVALRRVAAVQWSARAEGSSCAADSSLGAVIPSLASFLLQVDRSASSESAAGREERASEATRQHWQREPTAAEAQPPNTWVRACRCGCGSRPPENVPLPPADIATRSFEHPHSREFVCSGTWLCRHSLAGCRVLSSPRPCSTRPPLCLVRLMSSRRPWTCLSCTLENSSQAQECEVCGEKKPANYL